jgi:hypothetical protein
MAATPRSGRWSPPPTPKRQRSRTPAQPYPKHQPEPAHEKPAVLRGPVVGTREKALLPEFSQTTSRSSDGDALHAVLDTPPPVIPFGSVEMCEQAGVGLEGGAWRFPWCELDAPEPEDRLPGRTPLLCTPQADARGLADALASEFRWRNRR